MRFFHKIFSLALFALCAAALQSSFQIAAAGSVKDNWAVVNVSSLLMRQAPDYESAAVSQTRMGTLVKVLGREGYWVKIQTPEPYVGWVTSRCLAFIDGAEAERWLEAPRFICTAEYEHIYSAPDRRSSRVSDFVMGNIIAQVQEVSDGVDSFEKWRRVSLPDGRNGWVSADAVADFEVWKDTVKVTPERLVSIARLFMGDPYLWGGTTPGHFDCSGLVGFCYFMCGVLLPRDACQQVFCGEEVKLSDMRAGDLVFFGETRIAHVALCTGSGRIVHSSHMVRENSLSPDSSDYYSRRILHVRRILGKDNAPGRGATRMSDSKAYFKQ